MANVLFGWPIVSDVGQVYTPSLSGGSWLAGLPLANLQDRRLHKVARSSTDAVTDTVFTCDTGYAASVRVIALVNHNFSANAGGVRVRGIAAPTIMDAGAHGLSAFASGWSATGTPTRSADAKASTTGLYLDLLGDDDGAAAETYSRTVTFTGDGQKIVTAYIAEGTSPAAAGAAFVLRDSTAAADRLAIGVTWSAGAPVYAQTTGTVLASTAVGNGVYLVVMQTTAVTAANTNSLAVRPANTAAQTGNLYVGPMSAFDVATDPTVYDVLVGAGTGDLLPDGTDADDRDGWLPTWTHVLTTAVAVRYWRINISDTSNPDTYVEIGRLILASGLQPAINASVGAQLGWATSSSRIESDGGAYIHTTRARRREVRMLLENQSKADAFGDLWLLHQRAGTTEQMFFVFDPDDDATYLWRRSFLGVLRELSPIEFRQATYHATPIAITEELG